MTNVYVYQSDSGVKCVCVYKCAHMHYVIFDTGSIISGFMFVQMTSFLSK